MDKNGQFLSAATKRALQFSKDSTWFCQFREQDCLGDFAYEEGVIRRDLSAVILIGDLYYTWYTRGTGKTAGFGTDDPNAKVFPWDLTEIWYATSQDGWTWQEQGLAIGRGLAGELR